MAGDERSRRDVLAQWLRKELSNILRIPYLFSNINDNKYSVSTRTQIANQIYPVKVGGPTKNLGLTLSTHSVVFYGSDSSQRRRRERNVSLSSLLIIAIHISTVNEVYCTYRLIHPNPNFPILNLESKVIILCL